MVDLVGRAPTTPDQSQRDARRFATIASLVAAATALIVGVWFLSNQELALTEPQFGSNFYDAQARSWLDGTWSMPRDVVSLEGIQTESGLRMYFGPFPSVLRLPILLVTTDLDGRLTALSMFAAYAFFLAGVSHLWWQIRSIVAGDRPLTRVDGLLGAGAILVASIGSAALSLLASHTVYMEAILWGLALATGSYSLLLSCLRTYRRSTALGSVLLAGLAILTRASIGGGALVAIWLVAAVWILMRVAGDRNGSVRETIRVVSGRLAPTLRVATATTRQCALWFAGALAGTVAYMAINLIRFGNAISIPWDRFIINEQSTARMEVLNANDGSMTGLKFLPTTLWHYLRPDGVRFDDRFPYITLPRREITAVGDVVIDYSTPTASLTAMMPLLTALGIVGLVVILVVKRRGAQDFGVLVLPVIGAAVAMLPAMTLAFIAHRYLVDALPFLILTGFTGFQFLHTRTGLGAGRNRVVFLSVVALLAIWSIVATFAITTEFQRLIDPRDADTRYDFVVNQYRGERDVVTTVETVPTPGQLGDLVAVGDCEALLWSDGRYWWILEGSLGPEVLKVDPETKFFDRPLTDLTPRGDPVLCRQLQAG